MAQPTYRLASVLEFRSRLQQEAARMVAAARQQLADAEAELFRRHQAVLGCRTRSRMAMARMFEATKRGIEAYRLVEFRTHLCDLRRMERELAAAEEQQAAVAARAESELDRAIAALNEAHEQARIIEKHRESWRARVQREEHQREQKMNDEVSAVLYERQRRRPQS